MRVLWILIISIHALLAESDPHIRALRRRQPVFLSTLSLRRATISARRGASASINFYPRSPCGERHQPVTIRTWRKVFLSTLSLRRATQLYDTYAKVLRVFLSTLSLRRATHGTSGSINTGKFLSTLSLRRATRSKTPSRQRHSRFLSTLSLRRATFVTISTP